MWRRPASSPCGSPLPRGALPRVLHGVLDLLPRGPHGPAMLVAVPAGPQLRLDLAPLPAPMRARRLVPVAVGRLELIEAPVGGRVGARAEVLTPVAALVGPRQDAAARLAHLLRHLVCHGVLPAMVRPTDPRT